MRHKILADLQSNVSALGLDAIQVPTFEGQGYFSIEQPNRIGQLGKLHYRFCNSEYRLSLTVGTTSIALNAKQKPFSTKDTYSLNTAFIEYEDSVTYYEFVNTIRKELQVLVPEAA
jgi:hypothetical protein